MQRESKELARATEESKIAQLPIEKIDEMIEAKRQSLGIQLALGKGRNQTSSQLESIVKKIHQAKKDTVSTRARKDFSPVLQKAPKGS